jgi:hypothetical protein
MTGDAAKRRRRKSRFQAFFAVAAARTLTINCGVGEVRFIQTIHGYVNL